MKSTHKIAYNYCMAMIRQRTAEEAVSDALMILGMDNEVFSLSEPLETEYTQLVQELLGPELFEWLMWWMWECEMGTSTREFQIGECRYSTGDMTLYRFLEIVDAGN